MSSLSKTNAKSLIVIDSRVTDWQRLIGEVNQNATLLVLDSARDGLTQIAVVPTKQCRLIKSMGYNDEFPLSSFL